MVENEGRLALFHWFVLFATSDPSLFSLCGTSISPRIGLGIRGPAPGFSSLGPRISRKQSGPKEVETRYHRRCIEVTHRARTLYTLLCMESLMINFLYCHYF